MLPPSFETLASQAPQDEVRILRSSKAGDPRRQRLGEKPRSFPPQQAVREGKLSIPTDAHNLRSSSLPCSLTVARVAARRDLDAANRVRFHLDGSLHRESFGKAEGGDTAGTGTGLIAGGGIAGTLAALPMPLGSLTEPLSPRAFAGPGNAAHAGILGRRCSGSGQKTQDRNAHQCRSADHPSREKSKQAARVFMDR